MKVCTGGKGTINRGTNEQICLMLDDKCSRSRKISEEETKECLVAGLDTFCEADHNDIWAETFREKPGGI